MPNFKQEICLSASAVADLAESNEGPYFLNLRRDDGPWGSQILYAQLPQFCHNLIKNKYNLVVLFGKPAATMDPQRPPTGPDGGVRATTIRQVFPGRHCKIKNISYFIYIRVSISP
jgi:hypothetical protein